MKKGLRITAVALTAAVLLTGCNDGITLGTATEGRFEDMQKGESVDAQTVTTTFSDALSKAENSDSATIDTNVDIELTEDGQSTTTQQDISIKFASDETDSSADSKDDSDTTEKNVKANVKVVNTYNDETNTTEAYYEGGNLYYEYNDQKVKETVDYNSLMDMVGSYSIGFNEGAVESAVKVAASTETKYIIKFDPVAMGEMMMGNSSAYAQSENENIDISDAYLYFVVDGNGVMKGFNMEINANFTSEAESTEAQTGDSSDEATLTTSPFRYSLAANFTNLGSTKVEAFENLDDYIDVNTVLENMQNEAATEVATN
jgi:hypothetical protein